jgi:hypothetical protein
MKANKLYLTRTIALILVATEAYSQDEGFIYGKVTTIDNDVYEGALRWGKEEAFWTDMFNASKDDNKNLDYLDRAEMDYLMEQKSNRWGNDSWVNWMEEWGWDDNRFVHQFGTQFGNIKSLEIRSRNRVMVEMQNGDFFEVNGDGYNDIGTDVRVMDQELGTIELSWNRIETIEFMSTPKKLDEKFGEPLYGTVESNIGTFTGFVQWDHDERLSTDKLDGDTYDGDLSIDFGKVKSIERMGYSRSLVVLQSGRELELRGSNDVNSENRGIIVTIEGVGRVDIPWRDFDKVTFEDTKGSGPEYGSFQKQSELKAEVVTTNGDRHEGKIIYDLDEEFSFEVLQGKDDDTEFIIPFQNIKSITPRNYEFSIIKLRNGSEYTLGEGQDVSEKNEGILVFRDRNPIYIPWDKVESIDFK